MSYIPTPFIPSEVPARTSITHCYSILGVLVAVTSDFPEALERADERYDAFRVDLASTCPTFTLQFHTSDEDATFLVSDSEGSVRPWSNPQLAVRDVLDRMDHLILAQLQIRGIYAIQGSAMTYGSRALMLAGPSGAGKTTLVLGLLRRGLQLLSDEYILIDSATHLLLPYLRSIQVRPSTVELTPELHLLQEQPSQRLGNGGEQSLAPRMLERAFPGCLGDATPLGIVLLLDGIPRFASRPIITPMPSALATMELLRGTWATATDVGGRLNHINQLLDNTNCARLHVGALEATLDSIVSWLELSDGR